MKSLFFVIILFAVVAIPVSANENAIQTFHAEFSAPCGRSGVQITDGEKEDFIVLDPLGGNPIRLLRYHVLIQTNFEITGYYTGKKEKSAFCDCDHYPEFHITSYRVLFVGRKTDLHNLDPEMHVYKSNHPTNKFVPDDFVIGPKPKYIKEDSYTEIRQNSYQVQIMDFEGKTWFCTLKNN